MVKYCAYCGNPIDNDVEFCPFCYNGVGQDFLNEINKPKVNTSELKVMSASRMFLYTMFTLGLYQFYWFYKNNKMLKKAFNKDINPILRTIGLFLPFINWFMFYHILKDFRNLLRERGLDYYSLAANFIFMVFLPILGLNVFVFLNVQEYINDLCIYENPDMKINRKYSTKEILLLLIAGIITCILYILILFRVFTSFMG